MVGIRGERVAYEILFNMRRCLAHRAAHLSTNARMHMACSGLRMKKKKPLNAAVFMWSFFLLLLEEDLRIGGWTTIRDAYFFFPFIYLFVFVRGWHLKNAKCSQPINEQQNSRYAKRLPPAAEQKKTDK